MTYDHIIKPGQALTDQRFHLSCGFYDTTYFLFEQWQLEVRIHCNGTFTFRTADGQQQVVKAQPMRSGRGCYMDIFITTTDSELIFRLPEYDWWDNYPHCDGESDRWDATVTGTRDEVRFPVGA